MHQLVWLQRKSRTSVCPKKLNLTGFFSWMLGYKLNIRGHKPGGRILPRLKVLFTGCRRGTSRRIFFLRILRRGVCRRCGFITDGDGDRRFWGISGRNPNCRLSLSGYLLTIHLQKEHQKNETSKFVWDHLRDVRVTRVTKVWGVEVYSPSPGRVPFVRQ